MQVGIESIGFYTSRYFIDLKTLAKERGEDYNKYYTGIGQEKMAVPPPDEDIVTMAANAAHEALQNAEVNAIDMVMFATESGIDQSKAAGIYVHSLLELPQTCRVVELKQACYSATAALQMAYGHIHLHPESKVLVLASDIARYGLGAAGEPTQGAGAIALLVSASPKLLALDAHAGFYPDDVMDFWRPNYRDEALVDGKYSVRIYLKALAGAWEHYQGKSGLKFENFQHFCYHLPFTRMAEKAHKQLAKITGHRDMDEKVLAEHIRDSLIYNRITGNLYAASLYLGLLSLLENSEKDLSGQRLGLFSYGSGCVGEFFSGVVQNGYRSYLMKDEHLKALNSRTELSYSEYAKFYSYTIPTDGGTYRLPKNETGLFRFAALENHKRIYERVQ